MELYAEDAVWEAVGECTTGHAGRAVGHAEVRDHFARFWNEQSDQVLALSAHYVTSEQIFVQDDEAEGLWIHLEPLLFSDGTALLRSSRMSNAFRLEDGDWRITRSRTETVFVAPLPSGFASDFPTESVLLDPATQ